MNAKITLYLTVSILVLLFVLMFSMSMGAASIPLEQIISIILGGGSATHRTILLTLRLPRVIEAAVVGMGLAVSGTFFQGLLRNPMADSYVLGVSTGASFGATIAIVLGLGIFGLGLLAFIASLVTMYIVYMLAKSGPAISMTSMLLAGITMSAFMSSVISLLMLLNHEEFSRIAFWTMGGFSLISWNEVMFSAPVIIIGSLVMYLFSRDLNAIITGEEVAQHLGVDTEKVKKTILAIGSLITAAAVCVSGVIGFVGLIVPHVCRLIVGPDNRILAPFSAIVGAIFLVLADSLARTLMKSEIPVGIITAIFGGPFFLFLLVKNKNKGM